MTDFRSKRSSAVITASAGVPTVFAHSLGRGGRGALFNGYLADAAKERSPNVIRPASGILSKPSEMAAAPNQPQRDPTRFNEVDFVIVGCGGLGSQIAIRLAALGARRLLLLDTEHVDQDHLNHLAWASETDVGWSKADRLATYLAARFSADVFALMDCTDGCSAIRLIADYTHDPFVVLAGDDSRSVQAFLEACRASPAGLPPHLHVDRIEATDVSRTSGGMKEDACHVSKFAIPAITSGDPHIPSTLGADNSFAAGVAVSQIGRQCVSKQSVARGRQWISELKSDQPGLHSLRIHQTQGSHL